MCLLLMGCGAGGAAGGFVPSDVLGLVLWLDATAGLYQDSAGTTPASNTSDPVGLWEDQSDAGNDVTQGTSGSRPLLQLSIVNDLPVIRFDGTDDVLVSPSLAARTIFAVVRVATGGNSFVDSLLEKAGADTENIRRDNNNDGTTSWRGQNGDGNTDANDFAYSGTFHIDGSRTADVGEDVWHLFRAVRGTAAATNAWNIGGNSAQVRYLECDLAELLIYDVVLSAPEIAQVETYLSTKYTL